MDHTSATNCRRCAAPLTPGLPGAWCGACVGADLFSGGDDLPAVNRVGDYELMEELGRGGMGVVYRARQISLNRPAAVKLILTGPLASPLERQRFVAEAEAAAALDHPGIVSIYEAGEDGGQPFFAMQFIEGESLATRLRRMESPLPMREAAQLILRMAQAVQHAHERGFLHRDLKPGNILLSSDGEPHVTDFGLARRMDSDAHLTLTGSAVGTPSYMAPEQTDTRQPPTTAVDVYSLGAIFYEMLSGQPPFKADSLPALFMAIREKEPVSITAMRPGVDRDLDVICRKCLEKEPVRRYRTAQALADDLLRWRNGEPIRARAAGQPERFWRWCRRRPAIAGLAAAAAVFFLSGLIGIVWQWRRANKEANTAVAALNRAEEALWQASLNEAKALRISRARGQRTGSMEAIRKAAAYRPTRELRNEAIAALALPDLGEPVVIPGPDNRINQIMADDNLTQLAWLADNRIHLRRVAGGTPQQSFDAPGLQAFAASCDQSLLLTLWGKSGAQGGRTATLWRTADHTKVFEAEDASGSRDFTPDGRRLVMHRDGRLEVRDTATGEVLASGPCPMRPGSIVINPGGDRAVLTSGRSLELWSLSPPACIQKLPNLPEDVINVQWHPDDGTLVAGSATLAFHLKPGLQKGRAFVQHDREGVFVFMHPSGLFTATTSWDGVVRFSHPGLSDPLLQTTGLRPRQFSRDGASLLVTAGDRQGVCPVTVPDVWRCLPVRGDEEASIRRIALSPDGTWLAVVSQQSLAFWSTATLRMGPPVPLAYGVDGQFAADGRFVVSDRQLGLIPVTLSDSQDGSRWEAGPALKIPVKDTQSFTLSPDGTRVFVFGDRKAVCDLRSGAVEYSVSASDIATNLSWSPDGRWIASGYWNNQISSGDEVCVWSAAGGHAATRLPAGNCAPFFTPDGTRLVISSTHECIEYETGAWRELRRHAREASGLDHGGVAFAPAAGLMALMADESVIRIVSLSSGEELARLTQPFSPKLGTAGLAFSADGQWLACEARRTVRLWNLKLLREELRAAGLDWEDQPPSGSPCEN